MKSPFIKYYKAILTGECKEISNKIILSEFKYRFKKSHCDHIELKNDSELYVKNELIRFAPDLIMNFWTGVGKAEIRISEFNDKNERLITYKFFLTRAFIGPFILLLFLMISLIFMDIELESKISALTFIGSIIISIALISITIILIRHKTVFNDVIRIIKTGFKSTL